MSKKNNFPIINKIFSFSKFLSNRTILSCFLLILSVFLFVLANPNVLIKNGIGLFGFFIYLPVLLLINLCTLKSAWFYGLLYGVFSYGFYGYWLYNFHPLGLWIVCICYAIILAFIFTGLKIIERFFSINAWLVQFLFICVYEYVKTLGFFGFSYGVTAYTMWKYSTFIQIVDIIGVFGLNLVVIFPSAFLFEIIKKRNISSYKQSNKKKLFFTGIIWFCLLITFILYGFFDLKKGIAKKYVKVIAIQNNESPWKNGIEEYKNNVQILMTLSDRALQENPDAKIVVWSETAIAPSIIKNYYGKEDFRRYELVYNLLRFLNNKNCTFVIGNANEQNLQDGRIERYNSAFVFESGKNVIPPEPEVYSKMKLVPFTESFPWKAQFPKLYKKLLNGDFHMWEKGEKCVIFDKDELKFATPICFEDTFGNICRSMVREGARALINLSNDAWSKSEVCQNQHLAMAIFRSVENRVPSVRSTASGQTCIINQHGKIISLCEPFEQNFVVGKIPVYDEKFIISFYTKFGDIFGIATCGIFTLILIIQIFRYIIKKNSYKNGMNNGSKK